MAYITPNSIVCVLKGVSLDSSYNHTVLYSTALAQAQDLVSYLYAQFDQQSYQRVNKNKIRVARKADDLYNCNYLMFRNTAYGDKWFYAFIDSIDYINDHCSEIQYTIDVIQTWWFEFDLGDCFIEREHSQTDVAGDNTVPENFELGDKVIVSATNIRFQRWYGAIISTVLMPTLSAIGSSGQYEYRLAAQGNTTVALSGIPNGAYVYTGIPINKTDSLADWSGYDRQDYRVYDANSGTVDTAMTNLVPLTLGNFITAIEQTNNVSLDAVVGVYIYPADLSYLTYEDAAEDFGYPYGTALRQEAATITRPTVFYSGYNNTTYTPKNKKLLTYPYIDIQVSNNQGSEQTYQFERFNSTYGYKFGWIGIQNNPTIVLYPGRYNNIASADSDGITFNNAAVSLNSFIPIPTKLSAYDTWQTTQSNSANFSVVSSGIASVAHGALAVMNGSGTGLVNSALSLYNTIGSITANVADLKQTPDTLTGNAMNGSVNVAGKRFGFAIRTRAIKAEYARIIDDYFSMFGYARHIVKKPAVKDSNQHKRRYWNYIKTQGCIIHPATGTGLPSDDEKKIAQIFDNGITFWDTLGHVGNYSLTNSIV